mmetsp:Transcript_534/g.1516  ORF Transcript_534/g.1516 Transcript_534/m.1516 type:complete len:239 (+) Transcript_534:1599-2315(+)
MTQQRDGGTVSAHRVHHGPGLGYQEPRGAIHRSHIARHRHAVAAMPLKIKGKYPVSCAGQRQRKSRHHLLRPGKAMGNDNDGSIALRRRISGHRRLTNGQRRHRHTKPRALQDKERHQHNNQRQANPKAHQTVLPFQCRRRVAQCLQTARRVAGKGLMQHLAARRGQLGLRPHPDDLRIIGVTDHQTGFIRQKLHGKFRIHGPEEPVAPLQITLPFLIRHEIGAAGFTFHDPNLALWA